MNRILKAYRDGQLSYSLQTVPSPELSSVECSPRYEAAAPLPGYDLTIIADQWSDVLAIKGLKNTIETITPEILDAAQYLTLDLITAFKNNDLDQSTKLFQQLDKNNLRPNIEYRLNFNDLQKEKNPAWQDLVEPLFRHLRLTCTHEIVSMAIQTKQPWFLRAILENNPTIFSTWREELSVKDVALQCIRMVADKDPTLHKRDTPWIQAAFTGIHHFHQQDWDLILDGPSINDTVVSTAIAKFGTRTIPNVSRLIVGRLPKTIRALCRENITNQQDIIRFAIERKDEAALKIIQPSKKDLKESITKIMSGTVGAKKKLRAVWIGVNYQCFDSEEVTKQIESLKSYILTEKETEMCKLIELLLQRQKIEQIPSPNTVTIEENYEVELG